MTRRWAVVGIFAILAAAGVRFGVDALAVDRIQPAQPTPQTSVVVQIDPTVMGHQAILSPPGIGERIRVFAVAVSMAGLKTDAGIHTVDVLIAHTEIEMSGHDLLGAVGLADPRGAAAPVDVAIAFEGGRLLADDAGIFASVFPVADVSGSVSVTIVYDVEPV